MLKQRVLGVLVALGLFSSYVSAALPIISVYLYDKEATTYPGTVEPGDQGVVINAMVQNRGQAVDDVVATIDTSKLPFMARIARNNIGDLKNGEIASLSFTVDINKTAPPGRYEIPLLLNYLDILGGNVSDAQQSFYINVVRKPLLDLGVVDMPESIYPGDTVTISTKVENKGTMAAKDILVALMPTGATAPSYNPLTEMAQIVARLEEGEEEQITFRIKLDISAEKGAYPFAITLMGENQTTQENFILTVKDKPDIRIASTTTDIAKIMPGKEFTLSIQVENIGGGDAKAVKTVLQKDPLEGLSTSYIGSIDSEDTGSAIFDLSVPGNMQQGTIRLPIQISYEDEYGEKYSLNDDVGVYIHGAPPADYTMTLLVLAIVAGSAYYLYKRKQSQERLSKLIKKG